MHEKFYTTVGVGAFDDSKKHHVNKPNERFHLKPSPVGEGVLTRQYAEIKTDEV